MNTCHDFLFFIFLVYIFTFQESQEDGRCHATTFAAISFYVLFYFYFVLYCTVLSLLQESTIYLLKIESVDEPATSEAGATLA